MRSLSLSLSLSRYLYGFFRRWERSCRGRAAAGTSAAGGLVVLSCSSRRFAERIALFVFAVAEVSSKSSSRLLSLASEIITCKSPLMPLPNGLLTGYRSDSIDRGDRTEKKTLMLKQGPELR